MLFRLVVPCLGAAPVALARHQTMATALVVIAVSVVVAILVSLVVDALVAIVTM